MKEKKIVLSVVLGVALVSLIIALVSGLADGISILVDYNNLHGISYHDNYQYVVGGVELGAVCLGIAFSVVLLCALLKHNKPCLIAVLVLGAIIVAYLIATAIALKLSAPIYEYHGIYTDEKSLQTEDYTLFMAYLSSVIPITVTAVLAYISSLLLRRMKKKEEIEEPKQIEQDEVE